MHVQDIYQAQADMILKFMENKGIKREVLDIITGPPAWSASESTPRVAAALHRARVFKLYQDGVKQTEIARRTGRSQAGIAMLLQRARKNGELEKRPYDARERIELS